MSHENKDEDHATYLQRPRSPRIPAALDLELIGADATGLAFQTRVQTIKISYRGATIATDITLQTGATLRVVPKHWPALKAEVTGVWINEPDGRQYIGLKLLHPDGWFAE